MTVLTYTVDAYLTSDTSTLWLNTNYPYRRQFSVTGPVLDGYPIRPAFDISKLIRLNKVRTDYHDLVLAYLNSDRTWTLLGSSVQDSAIEFAAHAAVASGSKDDSYYLYYGNPQLVAPLTPPSYTPILWPAVDDLKSPYVTQTRPGVDWVNGVAATPDAKVTYIFTGTQVQVVADTGNYGRALIQIDKSEPQLVDLYSNQPQTSVSVYTSTGLADANHTLRIRPAGTKIQQSTTTKIKIRQFKSRPSILVNELGEQYDLLKWGTA